MISVKVKTRITKTTRLCVSVPALIEMMNKSGFAVPPNAEVTVEVPSGGDYSGMNLDLRDVSIEVMYTEGD